MCQLDWISRCPDIWLNVILGASVSVRVILEEVNTSIGRLSEVDCPPQCGWTASNLLKAWKEQKGCGRRYLPPLWFSVSVLELGHISSSPPSDWNLDQLPRFSGLQTQMEIHYQLSWLSSLQTADHGTSQLHKGMTQSLIINLLYILVILFLCRTLTNAPTSDVTRRIMNRKKSFPPGSVTKNHGVEWTKETPPKKQNQSLIRNIPTARAETSQHLTLRIWIYYGHDICVFSVSSFSKWEF